MCEIKGNIIIIDIIFFYTYINGMNKSNKNEMLYKHIN